MPHKPLRKAVNAHKLRCKACIGCLPGSDGISKTTMWKKSRGTKEPLKSENVPLSRKP
ncbi:hypothetical protein ACMYR2_0459 [Nitrobacter sp. TKz-YC01]